MTKVNFWLIQGLCFFMHHRFMLKCMCKRIFFENGNLKKPISYARWWWHCKWKHAHQHVTKSIKGTIEWCTYHAWYNRVYLYQTTMHIPSPLSMILVKLCMRLFGWTKFGSCVYCLIHDMPSASPSPVSRLPMTTCASYRPGGGTVSTISTIHAHACVMLLIFVIHICHHHHLISPVFLSTKCNQVYGTHPFFLNWQDVYMNQ